MNNKKILIVEDDNDIRELVRQSLIKEGWRTLEAADGREALESIKKNNPGLIILDLMLPEINGKEICRVVKSSPELKSIPIIMLTAKGEEVDRIIGFELGADDYLPKPFSPRELILRIKAILKRTERRSDDPATKVVTLGSLEVDIEKRAALLKGKKIDLTKVEFDILRVLLRRPGIVFSRYDLLDQALGIDAHVESRTIDMHVSRLREKLGPFGKHIETVRGIGYRISEDAAVK